MRAQYLAVAVALLCGACSSKPQVEHETVRSYCEGLVQTFDSLDGFAERREFDLLAQRWGETGPSNVVAHFRFCNKALVRDYAKNEVWSSLSEQYNETLAPRWALSRLERGDGTEEDLHDVLERLRRASALVDQVLRGGDPLPDPGQ